MRTNFQSVAGSHVIRDRTNFTPEASLLKDRFGKHLMLDTKGLTDITWELLEFIVSRFQISLLALLPIALPYEILI